MISTYYIIMIRILILIALIFIAQSNLYQKNSKLTLTIICYENSNTVKFCDFRGKSFKNCSVMIKLCLTNNRKYQVNTCQLGSNYTIQNKNGYCLRGIYDSREVLKVNKTFEVNLINLRIYAYVYIFPNEYDDYVKTDDTLYHDMGNRESGYIVNLKNYLPLVESYVKMSLKIEYKCLENFEGQYCQRFCYNMNNDCPGTKQPLCSEYGRNINCENFNFMENRKRCECRYPEKCSDEFESCLRNATQCLNQSSELRNACERFGSSPQILKSFGETHMPTIIIIGGLLTIILILLVALMLVYTRNKPRRRENTPYTSYRRSLPPYPGSIDLDYLPPNGIYEETQNER